MKTSNWKFWCQSIRATDAGVYIVEVDQGLKIGFTKKPHHRFSEMHKVGCNIMYRAWFPHDRPHELEKEVHNLLADDKIKNIFWPFSKCQTAPCELFELDYKTAIMLCEKEGIINTFNKTNYTKMDDKLKVEPAKLKKTRVFGNNHNSVPYEKPQLIHAIMSSIYPKILTMYAEQGPAGIITWTKRSITAGMLNPNTNTHYNKSTLIRTMYTIAREENIPLDWYNNREHWKATTS